MAARKARIFISYAAADKRSAQQLAEALRGESLDVWTDESLSPGENWRERIADALAQSDAMVVLLTPRSVESELVLRDVEYALSSKRFENRLIPVVIGEERAPWLDKAPWVLKHLLMVSSPSAAKASKRVADALKKAG